MKQQTLIVTGASSGIGKEVAKYFLERGDNVVINSATAEKLQEAVNQFVPQNFNWPLFGAGEAVILFAVWDLTNRVKKSV